MCYTGNCKYEDYFGECKNNLHNLEKPIMPKDALCVIIGEKKYKRKVKKNERQQRKQPRV